MSDGIGISATADFPGEIELDVPALAKECCATEKAVERSLGGRRMRVTKEPPIALALNAAQQCLRKAGREATALDAIVWTGDQVSGLRLQHELGALMAHVVFLDGDCAEVLMGIQIARGLVESGAKRVMVSSGERFAARHTDTAPTEQNYRNFLGDCGSAALVERTRNMEIMGFGSATRGADWDYLNKIDAFAAGNIAATEVPFFGQVFHEGLPFAKRAIELSLANSGTTMNGIDRFCYSSIRLPPLLAPLLRMLGIPAAKFAAHASYVHMGRSDVILDLETLAASRTKPGETAMIFASGVGVHRCMTFKL